MTDTLCHKCSTRYNPKTHLVICPHPKYEPGMRAGNAVPKGARLSKSPGSGMFAMSNFRFDGTDSENQPISQ